MRFRLETLLRLRKNQENLVQKAYADIQRHLNAQQDELNAISTSQERTREELNTRLEKPVDPSTLILYDQYFKSAKTRGVEQQQVITEVAERAEAKRAELIVSMQKRRTLEILRDQEYLRYRKKQMKRETALNDEVASIQWFTKRR